MTVNIIPLVLAGGAVAIAVSQSKKKKGDKKCPPTTVVTLGELRTVSDRAVAKFGSDSDPAREANYIVNEILPPACNRSSKNSRVKIQIQGIEKGFEMTIPDLYMLTFAQCLSLRADDERLGTQEADEFWARELDWYKKTTGSNFDAVKTGIAALAKIILEVIKNSMGGGKLGGIPPKSDICPPSIQLDMAQAAETTQNLIDSEITSGNRDPFKMADLTLAALFPQGCSKSNYETEVSLTVQISPNEAPIVGKSTNMSVFYAGISWSIAKRLLELNMIGQPKLTVIKSKILSDYKKLTGESFPYPEELN